MSTAREPCPNCQLPFYTTRNSDCPYCGAPVADEVGDAESSDAGPADPVDTTPAGSLARGRPPERPRVTCSNCGLPHYADDDTGCPYCGMTGGAESGDEHEAATPTAESAAETPQTASPGATASDASQEERSGGLLARIRGLFGG